MDVQIAIDKLPSIICMVAGAKAKMSAYDNGIYRMEKPYVITAGTNVIKTGFVQQINIVEE